MKRVIIGLLVLSVTSCQHKSEYTSVEVMATSANTGLPMDSLEFYVNKEGYTYEIADVDFTRHGHCRMSFEADSRFNYYTMFVGDYEVVNSSFSSQVDQGKRNVTEVVLAETGDLQIDVKNVNQTSNLLQYKISPLNPAHDLIPFREAYWQGGGGIQTSYLITNYVTYIQMPAIDYLVESRYAYSGTTFYDTISVKPDTLNVHTIQF